jgi:2-keto-3-deoxy-L-rhamnonate aldolase RhmA
VITAKALDAGVRGIMLPRVRDVVTAMKFPPHGRRGFDGIQAEADFGRTADSGCSM